MRQWVLSVPFQLRFLFAREPQVMGQVLRIVYRAIETHLIHKAGQFGSIVGLISKGDISGKIARDLFEIVYHEGGDLIEIVDKRGMKQLTDTGAIEAAVDKVIADNPEQVEKAKANPKAVNELVAKKLKT